MNEIASTKECKCNSKLLNLALGGFLDFLENSTNSTCKCYENLKLEKNSLDYFPFYFTKFSKLTTLDISHNNFKYFPDEICNIINLKVVIAKCNRIDDYGIPEKISLLTQLEKLDLCGNKLRTIPSSVLEISSLKELDLGANRIYRISTSIKQLDQLEYLYIGGNNLTEVPDELGSLTKLKVLSLSDNSLQQIPSSLGCLRNLETLSLHRNSLHALPPAIVKLRRLRELSLRNNPLVRYFVRNMEWEVPSLLELAGRATLVFVPQAEVPHLDIPTTLITYLRSAQHCANSACCGVYFTSRVEHIKFKDFCGKFRMPLLAFLCSPNCSLNSNQVESSSESSDDEEIKVRKVLLG